MGKLISIGEYIKSKNKTILEKAVDTGNKVKVCCLHDACPKCLGTGKNRTTGAICIHYLVCHCEKCEVKY